MSNIKSHIFFSKIKKFFKSILKDIKAFPFLFWLWLKRNILKFAIIVVSICLIVSILSVGYKYVPNYIRSTVYDGYVFDNFVMEGFLIENLEKPKGFIQEKFKTNTNFYYEVYSTESFDEEYLLYVKEYFESRNGSKFICGAQPNYKSFSAHLNWEIMKTLLPQIEKNENYLSYQVLYTNQFVKGVYRFKFVNYAVNVKNLSVYIILEPNEDGLYVMGIKLSNAVSDRRYYGNIDDKFMLK